MSIEAPEAHILSEQMDKELRNKKLKTVSLRDYQKLQRIGFINKNISSFDNLKAHSIESVVSRGNLILARFENGMNLLLGPEYGGKILYHAEKATAPKKFHLKLDFEDGTCLTVTLTGMGVIKALRDSDLKDDYVYKRDFSTVASPLSDEEFTARSFIERLRGRTVNIKSVLVGKEAVVVGLSNSAFQDVIHRAKIHPKKKVSDLSMDERRALFEAIRSMIRERLKLGGKDQFVNLYGKPGHYTPTMEPGLKDKPCKTCGTQIEKISMGGGQVFFCPECQKQPK